jgi:K+-transporting ATPase ATPase C chain
MSLGLHDRRNAMRHFRTSLLALLFFTVVLGGIYPLLMTGVGALFFPRKASGSLIVADGRVTGSRLIGQDFTSAAYFHPRPSAVGYDASSSGASNQGYTSRDLKKAYDERRGHWQKENGTTEAPMEMLFASGSGLDPDISPRAAELQVPRVAEARGISDAALLALVKGFEKEPQLGFMGEPRVNVLELNLALDKAFPK